jgi:maltodextrin utilization protein YvdJ
LIQITLHFWPKEAYELEHGVNASDIATVIEKKFISALERAIQKDLKGKTRSSQEEDNELGVGIPTHQTLKSNSENNLEKSSLE